MRARGRARARACVIFVGFHPRSTASRRLTAATTVSSPAPCSRARERVDGGSLPPNKFVALGEGVGVDQTTHVHGLCALDFRVNAKGGAVQGHVKVTDGGRGRPESEAGRGRPVSKSKERQAMETPRPRGASDGMLPSTTLASPWEQSSGRCRPAEPRDGTAMKGISQRGAAATMPTSAKSCWARSPHCSGLSPPSWLVVLASSSAAEA